MENSPQHSGEFVLTKGGSVDFGEISAEIAEIIKRQQGKIRLRIGQQLNTIGDYGEKHIERQERLAQLKSMGFENARDFVEYTCENFNEIYSSGNRLLLTKRDGGHTCIIELKPSENGDFYDVITGFISRRKSIENKVAKQKIRLLWQKP